MTHPAPGRHVAPRVNAMRENLPLPVPRRLVVGVVGMTGIVAGASLISGMLNHGTNGTSVPGWLLMKPNTAVGFLLSATALAFCLSDAGSRWIRWFGPGVSILVVTLGGMTLTEHLLGWNAGIDEVIGHDASEELHEPGRMAPCTALSFAFLGVALMVANLPARRWRPPLVKTLATTVALIGLLALAGHLADGLFGARQWTYTGMAAPAAICFILIGGALLAIARTDEPFTLFLDLPAATGFLAVVVLMLTAAHFAFRHTTELLATSGWISQQQVIIGNLHQAASELALLESSQRGFVITGDDRALTDRTDGRIRLEAALSDIRRLTAGRSGQQALANELDSLVAERQRWEELTLATRRTDGAEAAARLVANGEGARLRDQLRELISRMETAEYSLLAADKKRAESAAASTLLLLPLGTFVSLSVLFGGWYFLNTGLGERAHAVADLRRLVAVIESTDDGVISHDLAGNITSWNPGAERLFGFSTAEVIGKPAAMLAPLGHRELDQELLARIHRGEHVPPFDTIRVRRDGSTFDASITLSPISDDNSVSVGASLIARDVTENKRRERELARLTRLYTALSHVNQAIVRTSNRETLFTSVCDVLGGQGGFHLAWIGWHDSNRRRLVPVASWGDSHGYLETLNAPSDAQPDRSGEPSSTAFHEGRTCVNDKLSAENSEPAWRNEAGKRGIRSIAAFPIRQRGAPVGALAVCAIESGFFRDKEIALLEEVAGDISFALDNFANVEEHRQAEARAAREQQFSTAMLESMPGIVYFYDEQGKFLRWNRNFASMSGYSAREISRMHPLDFVVASERERLAKRISEVLDTGESFIEANFLARDGTITPCLFTGRRIIFEGKPCLVGMGIDISARKRAEADLRASEERYRTTLETMMEGCQIIAFDWTCIYLNQAAATHSRRPRSEILGRKLIDIWPGIERSPLFTLLRRGMNDRTSALEEIEFTFPDGRTGWFEVRCHPTPDGIFILSIDITERISAQAELLAFNADLEQRVVARTTELEALNHELESFCYSVSHDLRAPLRGIAGFTQILADTCGPTLDATTRSYFDRVLGAAHRMSQLIDDLLDLSRVTREEFHRESVDLSELAGRIVQSLRDATPDRRVRVEIAANLMVQGDANLLRILLENLLGNAWKFTTKISAARISFGAEETPGGRVFSLRDNGAGFDMRYAGKLFAPFQRLHRETEFPGTGIGLATVQRIIHRHGGRIWADSVVGEGAAFHFTLRQI